MNLDNSTRKWLRRIGHDLTPVVTLGEKGLSDGVRNEIERALADHELIKIRIPGSDRERRRRLIAETVAAAGAECVQTIGHVALLYRKAERPDPRLSNLLRQGNAEG